MRAPNLRVRGSIPRAYAMTTLYGEDAERLLADLERVCSPKECENRIAWAKRERAKMMQRTNQACEYCDQLDGDGIPIPPTPVTPAGGSDASQTEATEERESVQTLQTPLRRWSC